MSTRRIVCTEQTGCTQSGHIVAVGVGNNPSAASERMTVRQVYTAIDRGDAFYTLDVLGNRAHVRKYNCPCGRGSLKSSPDASRANNLDNLRICAWKAA